MARTAVQEIISVLNGNSSILDKKINIQNQISHRKGENRRVAFLVDRMLDRHVLPLRLGEKLRIIPGGQISEEVYSRLSEIFYNSRCPYFNAVCGEFLWAHFHDAAYANQSINAYYSEMQSPSYKDEHKKPC